MFSYNRQLCTSFVLVTTNMAANSSDQIITKLLEKQSIKKDKDVEELYLAKRNLSEVCDLQQFKYLKYLWLNGNKLQRISCIQGNCRLVELYLQDNELVEITGSIRHLTCLKLLYLNNNQLTKLDTALNEMNKMNCLNTLSLFDNPLAQEPDYRIYVINSLKSVTLLDRQEISKSERELARKIYQQDQNHVAESLAFGRRSDGPPNLYHCYNEPSKHDTTTFDNRDIGNSFLRDQVIFETLDDAVNERRSRKSLMLYTSMDWSKVPRKEERRMAEKPFDSPEIITHVYR